MFCSIAGAVFDHLGHVRPQQTKSHNGSPFTALFSDYDLLPHKNCAEIHGGGWWYMKCAIWNPTTVNPIWYVIGDGSWRGMKSIHMMIKLQ